MIDEINSTELHTCLLEITLLPLAHYWHFWYGPLDAAIYGPLSWEQKSCGTSSISDRVCGPQPK